MRRGSVKHGPDRDGITYRKNLVRIFRYVCVLRVFENTDKFQK